MSSLSRPGLSRAAIAAAAASVADRDGFAALSLASVAGAVGVKPPSLFNHVAGLPELRRDLALMGLRELNAALMQAAVGRSGDAAVLALGVAFRAFVRARPGLYAATVAIPPDGSAEIVAAQRAVVETVLAALDAYGLEGEAAIHAVRGMRAIAHGFATLEAADGFAAPLDVDESFRRLIAAYTAGLHAGGRGAA